MEKLYFIEEHYFINMQIPAADRRNCEQCQNDLVLNLFRLNSSICRYCQDGIELPKRLLTDKKDMENLNLINIYNTENSPDESIEYKNFTKLNDTPTDSDMDLNISSNDSNRINQPEQIAEHNEQL